MYWVSLLAPVLLKLLGGGKGCSFSVSSLCVLFFLRISKGLRTLNSNVLYVREVNEDPAITLFSTVERDRRVRERYTLMQLVLLHCA